MFTITIVDRTGVVEKRFRLQHTATNRFERLAAQTISETLEQQYYRMDAPPSLEQALQWGPIAASLPGGGSVTLRGGCQ